MPVKIQVEQVSRSVQKPFRNELYGHKTVEKQCS